MMAWKALLVPIASLLLPALAAQRSVLHFSDGRAVTGSIVKETDKAVFVDVGFDIWEVPLAKIVRRETVAPAGSAAAPTESIGSPAADEAIFSTKSLPVVSVREGVERVGEAVVKIESANGQGSGFVISEGGYVVTNFHVVEGEVTVSVTLYLRSKDGFEVQTVYDVEVVAINPHLDLALLKMDPPEGATLETVCIGDSEQVRPGETVYAIGAPIGLERTVSSGIVSVTNRTFGVFPHFQITAAINPGNSGGPLFNLRSEVIGVTNAKMIGIGIEGLNFAIPSKYVIDFLRNRDAFAFDSTRSEHGIHYLPAPAKPTQPLPESGGGEG